MKFNEKMNSAKAQKLEAMRRAEIYRILSNTEDDGREGRAFEIECARSLSLKVSVSAQGRTDVSIKMHRNGKAVYLPAECKTNGGRIDSLLDGSNKAKFVIYRLRFVQKHKAGKKTEYREELRSVPAVIIPTDLFLDMVKECNAFKAVNHNGKQDGIALQPSSKKMYDRLTEYIENYGGTVLFDRNTEYDLAEFDGLEL